MDEGTPSPFTIDDLKRAIAAVSWQSDDDDRAAKIADFLFPSAEKWLKEDVAEILLDERGWDEWYDGEDTYVSRLWDWDSELDFQRIFKRINRVVVNDAVLE